MLNVKKTAGMSIAAAAAALLLSGCGTTPSESASMTMAKSEAKVYCGGVNACKGQGGCAMAGHSCAGQNACKGQGWVEMGKDECTTKGGKVVS